jgi:carbon-monoxide dehydrogenase medium subunit
MYNFDYLRPLSISDTIAALSEHPDAKVLAGGMTLVPTLKQRLARPSHVIELGALPGLSELTVSRDRIVIGAMTTHARVAHSTELRAALPALADLAGGIGDPHVRHRGTIGGSIANNDPAADYPAAVLALNATIVTNRREIGADAFFKGMFETALEPNEVITSVAFPAPKKAGYVKFRNPASRYAITGVFVAQFPSEVRVAVTGAGSCVFRQTEMEQALARRWAAESIDGIDQSPNGLIDDLHGSPDYRAHLVKVLAKRAVQVAQ